MPDLSYQDVPFELQSIKRFLNSKNKFYTKNKIFYAALDALARYYTYATSDDKALVETANQEKIEAAKTIKLLDPEHKRMLKAFMPDGKFDWDKVVEGSKEKDIYNFYRNVEISSYIDPDLRNEYIDGKLQKLNKKRVGRGLPPITAEDYNNFSDKLSNEYLQWSSDMKSQDADIGEVNYIKFPSDLVDVFGESIAYGDEVRTTHSVDKYPPVAKKESSYKTLKGINYKSYVCRLLKAAINIDPTSNTEEIESDVDALSTDAATEALTKDISHPDQYVEWRDVVIYGEVEEYVEGEDAATEVEPVRIPHYLAVVTASLNKDTEDWFISDDSGDDYIVKMMLYALNEADMQSIQGFNAYLQKIKEFVASLNEEGLFLDFGTLKLRVVDKESTHGGVKQTRRPAKDLLGELFGTNGFGTAINYETTRSKEIPFIVHVVDRQNPSIVSRVPVSDIISEKSLAKTADLLLDELRYKEAIDQPSQNVADIVPNQPVTLVDTTDPSMALFTGQIIKDEQTGDQVLVNKETNTATRVDDPSKYIVVDNNQ